MIDHSFLPEILLKFNSITVMKWNRNITQLVINYPCFFSDIDEVSFYNNVNFMKFKYYGNVTHFIMYLCTVRYYTISYSINYFPEAVWLWIPRILEEFGDILGLLMQNEYSVPNDLILILSNYSCLGCNFHSSSPGWIHVTSSPSTNRHTTSNIWCGVQASTDEVDRTGESYISQPAETHLRSDLFYIAFFHTMSWCHLMTCITGASPNFSENRQFLFGNHFYSVLSN